MDFTSLDQLSKYLSSHAGQSMVLSNGMSVQEMMIGEANKIKQLIQKYMDAYFDTHSNSGIYNRTGGLQSSMSVDDFVDINIVSGVCKITIDFDSEAIKAYSIFDGEYTGYNKLELMDHGWEVRSDAWFHDIPNFGTFKGLHFLKDAIDEYNSKNPYGLDIKVEGLHYEI